MTLAIRTTAWALAALLFFTDALLRADDNSAAPKLNPDQRAQIDSTLKWQTGTITLKGGVAKIALTDKFRYLDHDEAEKVLHDLYGNPPDPDQLGVIFPADLDPLDENSWCVIVRSEDNGYVKDDDAATIDYTKMLKSLQEAVHDSNSERTKEGYPTMELVGWATPPHYDKTTHKLYWAKEFQVQGDDQHALNYDVRILGRHGVLVLQALAGMSQYGQIEKSMPDVIAMVDYQPGSTYADFDPKIDKVAEYGLAGLIAGGALAGAAKLGLFAGLFKFIVAGAAAAWKFILIGIAAIATGVKKLWGKISGKSKAPPDQFLPPQ